MYDKRQAKRNKNKGRAHGFHHAISEALISVSLSLQRDSPPLAPLTQSLCLRCNAEAGRLQGLTSERSSVCVCLRFPTNVPMQC